MEIQMEQLFRQKIYAVGSTFHFLRFKHFALSH